MLDSDVRTVASRRLTASGEKLTVKVNIFRIEKVMLYQKILIFCVLKIRNNDSDVKPMPSQCSMASGEELTFCLLIVFKTKN